MLPLFLYQRQAYRMAEKHPPSEGLETYAPTWEVVTFSLAQLATGQARINVQKGFTILAIAAGIDTAITAPYFNLQFFDTIKQRRFADRPVQAPAISGQSPFAQGQQSPSWFLLREPYSFDQMDSQILVQVKSMQGVSEGVNANCQIMFYGVALRFNQGANQ